MLKNEGDNLVVVGLFSCSWASSYLLLNCYWTPNVLFVYKAQILTHVGVEFSLGMCSFFCPHMCCGASL